MKTEINVKVKGMRCKSCAKRIEERLLELDGVEKAEASFSGENAKIVFDSEKGSIGKIEDTIRGLGYKVGAKGNDSKTSLKQGIIMGLMPHIGCIGFIAASVLGATVAAEFFKPLLMNPWFFHILVLISLAFATISAAFYLNRNGVLSWEGIKRKKAYLTTMYGSTLGVNLLLFLVVFPLTANLDTGVFQSSAGNIALASAGNNAQKLSVLTLQVDIPCSGHATLISGELKKINSVSGVKFSFPNTFDVAFDATKTSKEEILSLGVFKTYKATLVSESANNIASTASLEEADNTQPAPSNPTAGSIAQPASGCGCGLG